GQASLDTEGLTVDPHQFLGLEINPRAAAIAEIVLWIGYLQWHFRIHGKLELPEPILRDFHNIECRDALIDYDAREPMTDEHGAPVTIWDGISYRQSPTTGELIPDESGRITVDRYINPRKAEWPQADYIVGNPPFIGASTMRRALGDGYVDAVRKVYKGAVPESADFVMHWWHIAAEKVRHGEAKRFGLITTNSLRQTFNRRVVQPHLDDSRNPLSLAFAIPDHPWVDSNDGAAVRIAMTVGVGGEVPGSLREVIDETSMGDDSRSVRLNNRDGKIFPDLAIGADVAGAQPLKSQDGIAIKGFELGSQGFLMPAEDAEQFIATHPAAHEVLKPYMNGRDLTSGKLHRYVIDFQGFSESEAMISHPELFQYLIERVRPERQVNRESRTSKNWWLFRRSGADLRKAASGLDRFIVTTRTARHRVFQFTPSNLVAESKIVVIASDESWVLGTLSSRAHTTFALRAGGWLGAGNDATYNHLDCFGKFPMPAPSNSISLQVGELAERIDAHRKRQQAAHSDLTLTGMYNVLEKLRAGSSLTKKEQAIHEQGLVSVLRELHDELDRAVFAAYGWNDLADQLVGRPGATTPLPDKPAEQSQAEEELLTRLVALNARRAAEEARGEVRWLRPDYQAPEAAQGGIQTAADLQVDPAQAATVTPAAKANWPRDMAGQVAAVRDALASGPQDCAQIAAGFKRRPVKAVEQVLNALKVLGQARCAGGLWRLE
ncbi:MAG: class I SAM-dependent DNA methyltransferase, partial [Halothiobacillaceae bacterium]